jgi:hypothetical protein
MRDPARWARLLAAVWLGGLLCVGLLAAPVAFAVLDRPAAGRFVGLLFAREAAASVLIGALLMALQRWSVRDGAAVAGRSQADAGLLLPAGAVFCTVLGYYGLQPWVEQARAGTGPLTFGQLHAVSVAFFGVKLLLVAALAWRVTRPGASSG